jgi:hypothetical protein
VDELREEADRVQAELAVAEREWKEWVIARSRVGEVLAPVDETEDHVRTGRVMPAEGPAVEASSVSGAAKPKSQVPMWREGLAWSVLSTDYQRILQALADRHRLRQGPLTCQEMAGSGSHRVQPGGSTPPAGRRDRASSPAPGATAARPPTPRPSCPSGSAAAAIRCRRRFRTGEPDSHTPR